MKTELIKLAQLQDALRKKGGPSEDGNLFEEMMDFEAEILKHFGLPLNPHYLEIIQFENLPNENEIEYRIEQLKNAATAYLTRNAKPDVQILRDALGEWQDPFTILAELKVTPHVYSIFVYNRILLKRIDTVENVLQELRFVNNEPDILDATGRLRQDYRPETPHYDAVDILTRFGGEEKYLPPEEVIDFLRKKGVRYIDQFVLSLTDLLSDDEVDEMNISM
ncbi:MAG TPA: hypothetical protein VK588_02270 [Chitinophagaceae bacterium]|nr:hypothetical protein [Chitinophagaceae bacterium]